MLAGVGLALDRHGRMGVIGMVATRLPMGMVPAKRVTLAAVAAVGSGATWLRL